MPSKWTGKDGIGQIVRTFLEDLSEIARLLGWQGHDVLRQKLVTGSPTLFALSRVLGSRP